MIRAVPSSAHTAVSKAPAGEYHEQDFIWQDVAHASKAALLEQKAKAAELADPPRPDLNAAGSAGSWERFYQAHSSARFFKERRYMPLAFPALVDGEPPLHIVELGAGAGAALLPILKANRKCTALATDVSATALECLRSVAEAAGAAERVRTAIFDATDADSSPVAGARADAALLVFTLAAVHPDRMPAVLRAAYAALKPGGALYFRDHGLYDMTSLRFPPEQRLGDQLYYRSDGTLVYYIAKEELQGLAHGAGFVTDAVKYVCVTNTNRKTGVSLNRVFVQGVFRKPGA